MPTYAHPRLVVSRCLEFDACRWNGLRIASEVVRTLQPHVDWAPVCPEVEIGLGVPRDPIRLVAQDGRWRLLQPATGRDCTEAMEAWAERTLDEIGPVDGFILKSRSPSCGIKDVKVYRGDSNAAESHKGRGLFGARVLARFADRAVEDEGRLTNYTLREHFYTRVFVTAAFRALRAAPAMRGLVQFHAENKLLLLAYDEAAMRQLGRLVANHERLPLAEVLAAYEGGLQRALSAPPRYTATINVLMHALGYFSGLSSAEKAFFLHTVEAYRAGRAPLSACASILRAWIIRFDVAYLAQQTFFAPYPPALVTISDSGKGRSL